MKRRDAPGIPIHIQRRYTAANLATSGSCFSFSRIASALSQRVIIGTKVKLTINIIRCVQRPTNSGLSLVHAEGNTVSRALAKPIIMLKPVTFNVISPIVIAARAVVDICPMESTETMRRENSSRLILPMCLARISREIPLLPQILVSHISTQSVPQTI